MATLSLPAYQEAVQNPSLCFSDAALRGGYAETDPLGLPRAISGNFAIVFRLRNGAHDWAVKCFFRQAPDIQQRYAAIGSHLQASQLPYTVGFQYLPDGMLVLGQRCPVLKMEWVEGEPLHLYVERCVRDARQGSAALEYLAHQWHSMVTALDGARIAHGDLQHGNVLVVNGELKLVDYDGMYVPALAGLTAQEIGHPNYQHPQRIKSDYGPALDRFSAWVIYASLVALSVDAGIWQRARGGDECLIFRKADFDQPDRSSLFQALSHHAHAAVRDLADQLRSFLALSPRQVPALTGAGAATPSAVGSVSGLPGWLTASGASSPAAAVASGAPAPPAATGAPLPVWLATPVARSAPTPTTHTRAPALAAHPPARARVAASAGRTRLRDLGAVLCAALLVARLLIYPALHGVGIAPSAAERAYQHGQAQLAAGAPDDAVVSFARADALDPSYASRALDRLWQVAMDDQQRGRLRQALPLLSGAASLARHVGDDTFAARADDALERLARISYQPVAATVARQSWLQAGNGPSGARYAQLGGLAVAGPSLLTRTLFIPSADHLLYAVDALTGDVRWRRSIDARAVSVAGGVVFAGSADRAIYALRAATGHTIWRVAVGGAVGDAPVVANGLVYAGSADHYVYALRARTGTLVWRARLGGVPADSPALVDETLYVASRDRTISALNARTGRRIWRRTLHGAAQVSPVVAGDLVLVAVARDALYALDARTGKIRWRFQLGLAVPSSPAVMAGTVFVGSTSHRLYALDGSTGRIRWTYTTAAGIQAAPTASHGVVYVPALDHALYALDAATGHVLWRFVTGSALNGSAALGADVLAFGSRDHWVYGVDAATGARLWRIHTGGELRASAAMSGL